MDAKKVKGIVIAAAFGGAVYAILMSLFYQFYEQKPFNLLKFVIDFVMFGIIMGIVAWWGQRKKTKN